MLVPFIDESRLLEAMKAKSTMLTSEEVLRNQHGPMVVCNYSADVLGKLQNENFDIILSVNITKSGRLLETADRMKGLNKT